VVKLAPPDTHTVLEGNIEGYRGETPYMKMGGSLPLVCGLLCLAVLLMLVGWCSHAQVFSSSYLQV